MKKSIYITMAVMLVVATTGFVTESFAKGQGGGGHSSGGNRGGGQARPAGQGNRAAQGGQPVRRSGVTSTGVAGNRSFARPSYTGGNVYYGGDNYYDDGYYNDGYYDDGYYSDDYYDERPSFFGGLFNAGYDRRAYLPRRIYYRR